MLKLGKVVSGNIHRITQNAITANGNRVSVTIWAQSGKVDVYIPYDNVTFKAVTPEEENFIHENW